MYPIMNSIWALHIQILYIHWYKWYYKIFVVWCWFLSSPALLKSHADMNDNLDSSFSGHTIVWDQYTFGTSSFFFWSKQWKWRYIDFKLLHNYWDQVVGPQLNTNVTWNGPFKHMEFFSLFSSSLLFSLCQTPVFVSNSVGQDHTPCKVNIP